MDDENAPGTGGFDGFVQRTCEFGDAARGRRK